MRAASAASRSRASARRKSPTRRARNRPSPLTRISSASIHTPRRADGACRITCGRPPTGTAEPSANATGRGSSASRPVTQSGMRPQQRQPGLARRPRRQRHHHRAGPEVDPQRDPARPAGSAASATGASPAGSRRQLGLRHRLPRIARKTPRGPAGRPPAAADGAGGRGCRSSVAGVAVREVAGRQAPDHRGRRGAVAADGPRQPSGPVHDMVFERSGADAR